MSVEATALSRSRLEQKDRAELAAIVEAMGGKAGSRAKKADLVDQVLELAGAGTPALATNGAGATTTTPTNTTSARIPSPSAVDDEPPADWELSVAADGGTGTEPQASADAPERHEVAGPRAASDDQRNGDDQRGDDQRNTDDQRGDDQRGDDQRGDDQRNSEQQ